MNKKLLMKDLKQKKGWIVGIYLLQPSIILIFSLIKTNKRIKQKTLHIQHLAMTILGPISWILHNNSDKNKIKKKKIRIKRSELSTINSILH